MKHTVTGKRQVPVGDSVQSGKKAVCVRLFDGYMAWGYADTWEDAERAAADKAKALRGTLQDILKG